MARPALPPTRRIDYPKGGHGYLIDGVKAPGPTTIIGKGLPKPALMGWAARTVAEAAVHKAEAWQQIAATEGADEAVRWLKNAHTRDRDRAASRGTNVHELVERLANGEAVDVPDDQAGHVDAALAWFADWGVEVVATEVVVINRTPVLYAGTADLICTVEGFTAPGERTTMLVDYKTGASGLWADAALQIAAYCAADAWLPEADGSAGERPFSEFGVEAAALLWLRDDGTYRFAPVDTGPDVVEAFGHVAAVAELVGDRGTLSGWLHDPVLPSTGEAPDVAPFAVRRPPDGYGWARTARAAADGPWHLADLVVGGTRCGAVTTTAVADIIPTDHRMCRKCTAIPKDANR